MPEYDAAEFLLGRSAIRRNILRLFFEDVQARRHLRAIARDVGTSAGTASRELGKLEAAGLIERQREGNQVYFVLRSRTALAELLGPAVRGASAVPMLFKRQLAGLKRVKRAVIFGSYASGTAGPDSDVDLLIVGDPDRDKLTDLLERIGHEIGREVNEVVMTEMELAQRRARGDGFVRSIDAGPTLDVTS